MKGKGYRDVFVLMGEGYIPPEAHAPMKKNSIRKSIFLNPEDGGSSLFTRRVRMTQKHGEPENTETSPIDDNRRKTQMPEIKEMNESKHYETEESKLSKRDLSASFDSQQIEENPESSDKHLSDKAVTLDQDIHLSPRRSQNKPALHMTRIPSLLEIEARMTPKASPHGAEKDRKSLNHMMIPVPDEIEEDEILDELEEDKDDNFMPDEIDSPGLKSMKKKIQEEARLSQMSPKNAFLKRTSAFSVLHLNNLVEKETPQVPKQSGLTLELHKIEDKSPNLSPIPSKRSIGRDLIIPIVTPDDSPKRTDKNDASEIEELDIQKPANSKHRASIKMSEPDKFLQKLNEIGESALNEIRTPQGVRSQNNIKEMQIVSVKRDSTKMATREPKFRYGASKEEVSIAFSRKGSVEDVGSDSDSEKGDKDSLDEPVDNFTEFENETDQEEAIKKNSKFREEYKRKISLRYQNISNLCLGMVCLDMILSELYFFSDSKIHHNNNSYHLVYFFLILFLLVIMVMRVNVRHLDLFKTLITSLLFIRLFSDFAEIYLYLNDERMYLK